MHFVRFGRRRGRISLSPPIERPDRGSLNFKALNTFLNSHYQFGLRVLTVCVSALSDDY